MKAVSMKRVFALKVAVVDLDRASRWCYRGALLFAVAIGVDFVTERWPLILGAFLFSVLAVGCELYRLVLVIEYPDVYWVRLRGWIRRPSAEVLAKE